MKAYEISNNIRTRCISPKRSSEVISHLVLQLIYFYFVSKIPAVSGPERQVPDCSGTNQIAGFHVLHRSRK